MNTLLIDLKLELIWSQLLQTVVVFDVEGIRLKRYYLLIVNTHYLMAVFEIILLKREMVCVLKLNLNLRGVCTNRMQFVCLVWKPTVVLTCILQVASVIWKPSQRR